VNCNKVSHLLSAFMDGELLGYEHRLIHHHLQRCADCRTEYEELLQMKRLLAAMRVREPGQRLADAIVQRVSDAESARAGVRAVDWKRTISGLHERPLVFSPIVGLGVGIAFFGMLFSAHPPPSSATGASARTTLEFATADTTHDELPQHVGELTNGLMRETVTRPVTFEARYSDDLPDFPLRGHQSPHMRAPVSTVSFFR
jgi:predicted anti-sigma-YlaC factor YlaD